MAQTYRPLDDGGFLIETPAGSLRTALSENALQAAGLVPYEGATAYKDPAMMMAPPGMASGMGLSPPDPDAVASDAPAEVPGATAGPSHAAGFRPSRGMGGLDQVGYQGPGLMMPAGKGGPTPELVPAAPSPTARVHEPSAKANQLRGGSTVEDIDLAGQVANGNAAPPPARFFKTGGKDIRAGFQVQKSGISDEERAELKERLGENEVDIRLGMMDAATREKNRLRDEAERFEENELAIAQEAVRAQREKQQWINRTFAEKQQTIQRERAAIEKLEVSPEQVYQDGGIGLRIGAIISMIAGGMLQGRRGGNNPGLEAVNKVLADGMEALREKRAAKERGVQARETELDRLAALYGSPEAAELELRKRQLDYAGAQAKKYALETGSADVMARVQSVFAERDRERLLENAKLDQELRDRVTESWAYQPERTVQVGGPQKPKGMDRMVRVPGGGYGWARDPSSAREVQGKITVGSDIAATLGKMKKLASDGTLTDLQKRAQYEAYKQDIDALINVAKGQGAMGVEEAARMTNLTGDPTVILNPQNTTRLDIAIRQQTQRNNGLIRDYLHADPDATQPLLGGRPNVREE